MHGGGPGPGCHAMGFDVQKSSPALFTAAMNKERPVWERLIKASGAKLD